MIVSTATAVAADQQELEKERERKNALSHARGPDADLAAAQRELSIGTNSDARSGAIGGAAAGDAGRKRRRRQTHVQPDGLSEKALMAFLVNEVRSEGRSCE